MKELKATGMVRRLDNLGRLVIPKEIRQQKGMELGCATEIFLNDNNDIVVRKYTNHLCNNCGAKAEINFIYCSQCGETLELCKEAKEELIEDNL